jgi:hypothetical protein
MPGRHGGVGDQRRRIGRNCGTKQTGPDAGGPTDQRRAPGDRRRARQVVEWRIRRQDPRADTHRRRRLQHPQHVHKSLRPPEILDQRRERNRHRGTRAQSGAARQTRPGGGVGSRGEDRGGARQATAEQVPGDLTLLPDRRVDDRPSVVGVLGRISGGGVAAHRSAPSTETTPAASSAPAAMPTRRHIAARSRVVTIGFGGSP